MRRPGVELRLSKMLRQERRSEDLELQPNKAALKEWAAILGTKVHRKPRILLMHPEDEIDRNLALFLSEERTLPVEIDVLEQKVVTHGIAKALHQKAEVERRNFRMVVENMGRLGWSGGFFLGLAGATAGNTLVGAIGGAGLVAGGLVEGYVYARPFEPHPLPELPDIEPAVVVTPRT